MHYIKPGVSLFLLQLPNVAYKTFQVEDNVLKLILFISKVVILICPKTCLAGTTLFQAMQYILLCRNYVERIISEKKNLFKFVFIFEKELNFKISFSFSEYNLEVFYTLKDFIKAKIYEI